MALINNIYVHITDEKVGRNIKSTDHPTEKGIDITDNVKREPVTLSISGKIVDTDTLKSHEALAKLYALENNGSLITYSGRNIIKNMQIQSFNSTHPNTNAGGLDFDMELKEVRIAQNSYSTNKESGKTKATEKAGTQQVSKGSSNAVYHTVKKGDTVWKLVNINYKELGSTVQWVIDNSPNAFSKKGDATTLKVGAKLLMGYKEKDKNDITQYGVEATWLYTNGVYVNGKYYGEDVTNRV